MREGEVFAGYTSHEIDVCFVTLSEGGQGEAGLAVAVDEDADGHFSLLWRRKLNCESGLGAELKGIVCA